MHHEAILVCPGPVAVSPTVKRVFGQVSTGHRTPEAKAHLATARKNLVEAYELFGHEALLLAGSGTSAVEAIFSSAVPTTGKLLILVNGRFGERMTHIATALSISTVALNFGWNQPIEVSRVRALIAADHEITHLALVHHETSTGRLNDLDGVLDVAESHGVKSIVDMVSSFGAESLNGIHRPTWIATSANKCLESYPGVGIVIAPRTEFEGLSSMARSFTHNLSSHYEAQVLREEPLFTPPVQVVAALAEATHCLIKEGVAARSKRYRHSKTRVSDALAEFHIRPITPNEHSSSSVSVFHLPGVYQPALLVEDLLARNIVAYGADSRNPNAMTIATMGQLKSSDIDRVIWCLRALLSGTHAANKPFLDNTQLAIHSRKVKTL